MYKRISCDIYDQYEIYAMRGTLLNIRYRDEAGEEHVIESKIKTLQTLDKAEYLITETELRIRLDRVVRLEEIV